MERLTEKFSNGQAAVAGCGNSCKFNYKYCKDDFAGNCPTLTEIYEKLASYEDLEEQGLLLRLPCKVGDTVWEICRSLTFREVGDKAEVWYRIEHREFTLSMRGYFGKTVFLTRTEAEQALAEMEKEK